MNTDKNVPKLTSANEKLQELYKNNLQNIKNIFDSGKNIDGPHLMYCWDEQYCSSSRKILFVGQENTGWVFREYWGGQRKDYDDFPEDIIDACIGCYQMIVNIENKNKSLFWRKLMEFNEALNYNQDPHSSIYTELSKYCNCQDEGKPPLSWEDDLYVARELPLLAKEIEICQPDVVIFLTGTKHNDFKIELQLPGVLFEQVYGEIPANDLARVVHPMLPKNSYRTWHPNGAKRAHKSDYTQFIISTILYEIPHFLAEFKTQLTSMANELKLECFPDGGTYFGQMDSSISFKSGNVENYSITIGFDADLADFYYGVRNLDRSRPLSTDRIAKFSEVFQEPEGANENFSWCRYFEKYRNWDDTAIKAIKSGDLIKHIKDKIVRMQAILISIL